MTNSIHNWQLKAIISNHYDLGELVDYEQLHSGYVNVSYIIEMESKNKKKRFFLRRYKWGIKEEEITFEHSIINHLKKKNFRLEAGVILTRDGKTYVKRSQGGENVFYAIFDLLTGDDRYTWVNPNCNNEDLKGAAAVLARFHYAVFDLIPKGRRYEARIIDLLPEITETVEQNAQKAGKTVFDTYFLENINLIQENIQRIQRVLEKDEYEQLIQLVIHCDYHPGNLKFQNSDITGLFDFDSSKVDVRCFDVALAITYFCVAWEGKQDGDLQLNKVAVFLDAYQDTLRDTPDMGPLGYIELKFLPYLIAASNIYVLKWTMGDYYGTEADPLEYLIYLQHGVRFMKWLENKDNRRQLKRTIKD